jgi:hypothetical protein
MQWSTEVLEWAVLERRHERGDAQNRVKAPRKSRGDRIDRRDKGPRSNNSICGAAA